MSPVRARGAEAWVTLGTVGAAGLNYAFTLVLTVLLTGADFAAFAAGQALLLIAGTVAAAGVPWVLAQAIARDGRAPQQRSFLLRFSFAANAAQGVVATALVCALALPFADAATLVALGVATLSVFLSTVTVGWAQGLERFGLLAAIVLGEVAGKIAFGAAFVQLGAGPAGAFAGASAGALIVLAAAAYVMRHDLRAAPQARPVHGLLRGTLGMTSVQALITGMGVLDVVLAAMLLTGDADLAAYTLAATVGRAPLFLGVALSVAIFPRLSRDAHDGRVVSQSLRRLLIVGAPAALIAITAPAALLELAVPSGYERAIELLPYTLCGGFAFAVATLLAGALKAVGAFARSLQLGLAGALVTVAGVTAGALAAETQGLAIGAVAGAVTTAALFTWESVRRWPGAGWNLLPDLLPSIAMCGVLVLTRGHTFLWGAAAAVVAAYALQRLLAEYRRP
ncbi:oligosaccharide flippase family protein [Solirubrobacter deserti]|uniref:Oligosaccharide flippase family protein n=1 Tax=Solirubrobacter deserti TaxID=2282478 RepID=A0ABT4RLE7_9ACTN|nr:oligosaccharide flippase family protein [Solirubrobacter deserti]MDA0139391.1 oligosaccharide flippase family protein [Solirubrobacter deserti]